MKFLETEKNIFNIFAWFLAGLFINFEAVVGIFVPFTIIIFLLLTKRKIFLKKTFYLGPVFLIITLLPQLIFDLRHNFIMTRSLFEYKSQSHGSVVLTPSIRIASIFKSYYETILPTFMNLQIFTKVVLGGFFLSIVWIIKEGLIKKDKLTILLLVILGTTFIGLMPLKVDLMRWHLNAVIIASIMLVGVVISTIEKLNLVGKIAALSLVIYLTISTLLNMNAYMKDSRIEEGGNSLLRSELSAIDLVYREANGKNFKVYTYIPSVYDYPYQYLFWWHGMNKYGYLPEEYAYLPKKPQYISGKDELPDEGSHPESSGLIFLIKEPDQINQRHLWENTFKDLELIDSKQIGSIIVETRKDSNSD